MADQDAPTAAGRLDGEQVRRLAEESREARDQHRDALETIRQEQERLRIIAETARAASEEARLAAETARAAGEDARKAAEAVRQSMLDSVHATANALKISLAEMKVVEDMRRALRELQDPDLRDLN